MWRSPHKCINGWSAAASSRVLHSSLQGIQDVSQPASPGADPHLDLYASFAEWQPGGGLDATAEAITQ
jgi:hypothetical protein